MDNSCFSFLVGFNENLYLDCLEVEKFYKDNNYSQVIISCSQISEDITKKVADNENFTKLIDLNQFDRLKILGRKRIIRFNYQRPFNGIRRLEKELNKNGLGDLDSSKKAHKFLFDIMVWYYKKYNDSPNSVSVEDLKYYLPQDKYEEQKFEDDNGSEEIEEEKHPDEFLKSSEEFVEEENILIDGSINDFNDGLFKEYKNSHLLGGLKNLEMGSKESVEGNNLSNFKNYLHVNRSIHNEFLEEVKRVYALNSSYLIIICGSVGDGKSHLLAHFNEEFPEIFKKFEIQGDGTESYDYDEDSLPSLARNLEDFNDDNIGDSSTSTKFILAINLGILNNFFDSPFGENFETLKEIINRTGVLNNNLISNNYISKEYPVSIFSFTDYNLFELTNNKESNFVTSDYLSNLFSKIASISEDNPFFNSYIEDKKQLDLNFDPNVAAVVNNYEIFLNKNVQKIIIEYLIKISVINKIIIPTRDILDLIYNIIVPPKLIDEEYFYSDYLNVSLPSLLFNYPDRSFLLSLFNQFDPSRLHNRILDDLLIDLNINPNLNELLEEYFVFSEIPLLKTHINEISSINELLPKQQMEIPQDLIRFLFFFGNPEKRQCFVDEDYLNFLKFLYEFNVNNHMGYWDLFEEVINSISAINGSNRGFLSINSLNNFNVYKKLELNPIPYSDEDYECSLDESGRILNRFKLDIAIQFEINNEMKSLPLFIDFNLYKYISMIVDGYKPNKLDKEDLLVFEEFINNLKSVKNQDDMYIEFIDDNYIFKFGFQKGFNQFYLKSD